MAEVCINAFNIHGVINGAEAGWVFYAAGITLDTCPDGHENCQIALMNGDIAHPPDKTTLHHYNSGSIRVRRGHSHPYVAATTSRYVWGVPDSFGTCAAGHANCKLILNDIYVGDDVSNLTTSEFVKSGEIRVGVAHTHQYIRNAALNIMNVAYNKCAANHSSCKLDGSGSTAIAGPPQTTSTPSAKI